MTEELEKYELFSTAGDIQIASVVRQSDFGEPSFHIRFSRQGVKKSLYFEEPDLDELKQVFKDLEDEAEIELMFECRQCGMRITRSRPGAPYKCDCGCRKFDLIDGFDTVDKKTGNILLSVYLDDEELKLEVADNQSKKAEIFEDVNGCFEDAATIMDKIKDKYVEYQEGVVENVKR